MEDLQQHKLNLHDQSIECSKCEFKCADTNQLNAYVEEKHWSSSDQVEYNCEKCTSKFQSSEDLRMHMDDAHRLGSVYLCALCDFKTENKKTLEDHMKHHNLTEYKCD